MTDPDIPKGVLPVLQTPFNGDGEIDQATLVREIDWAFGCGVHGLTVAMVSEILRMDHRERRQLSERVCSAVYDGSGGIALIDTFRRGIVGTMPGTDLCWALVRLWNYLQAGNYEAAYRVSQPLVALVAMQTSLETYVAVEKYLLVQQDVFVSDACREPSGFKLDDQTMHQIDIYFLLLKSAFHAAAEP